MKKEEIVMTEYLIFNFIHILFYSNFITDLNIDRLLWKENCIYPRICDILVSDLLNIYYEIFNKTTHKKNVCPAAKRKGYRTF